MNVNEKSVSNILGGTKRYIIPPYQRPYTWEDENVEELINDINESLQSGKGEYFIGSLICINKGNDIFEVVDGQQRLTTLTLIFSQLARYLGKDSGALKEFYMREDPLDEDATPTPVIDVRKKERWIYTDILAWKREKLKKLTDSEKVFVNNEKSIRRCLAEILGNIIVSEKVSENMTPQLTDALEISREEKDAKNQKQEEQIKAAKKFAAYIRDKVNVVLIEVDGRENAFRLFNVLNSRGTPLNDADLIKSKLLELSSGDPVGSERIEDDWLKMEECAGERDLNTFLLMNQISEKEDRDRVAPKNYPYYEKMLKEQFANTPIKMTARLLKSATNYQNLMDNQELVEETSKNTQTGIETRRIIAHLHRLNYPKEWLPAFLAFLNRFGTQGIDKSDFPQFAKVFEKVYMHRLCAGLPAGQREIPCYFAVEAINTGKTFVQLLSAIQDQSENKEFMIALDNREFYDQSRPRVVNLVKCILLRLEDSRGDGSVEKIYTTKQVSVEHIMPKSRVNCYWKKKFTEEQHTEWLHRLGNLTLLLQGKNSKARDLAFGKKKAAYMDKKKAPLKITEEVCQETDWSMDALQARHDKLKQELIALWGIDGGS